MICRECGKEIEDDVTFCYFCGAECSNNVEMNKNELVDEETIIKCPICQGQLEKGIIKADNINSLLNLDTVVSYYKDDEASKLFKKGAASLELKAEGYFCVHCNKYIGIFDPR